jgi:hypothetical protein
VVLRLYDGQDETIERAVATHSALTMQDGEFCRFEFPPLADSNDHEYTFWLESPEAVLGDCVTVFSEVETQNLVFSPVYG